MLPGKRREMWQFRNSRFIYLLIQLECCQGKGEKCDNFAIAGLFICLFNQPNSRSPTHIGDHRRYLEIHPWKEKLLLTEQWTCRGRNLLPFRKLLDPSASILFYWLLSFQQHLNFLKPCNLISSYIFFSQLLQDYHRFHSPVSGTIEKFVKIPGCLYTVCIKPKNLFC